MPELGREICIGKASDSRDSVNRRNGDLAGLVVSLVIRMTNLSRGALLKAAATLIALSLISTILAGSGGYEHSAQTTALRGGFSPPVMVNDNGANDRSLPVIVATPNHGLFVVWQDLRSGSEDIYASSSIDNGTTFAPNRRADDSIGLSRQIEPAAAVSGNGTILLTWQDNRRNWIDWDIFFTESYDGGATFAKNVKVDDSTGSTISWQERPSIAVTPGGAIYVAWTDDRTGPGHLRVRGAFSTDWGATFSPSAEIAPSGSPGRQDEAVLATSGNRIFAAFMDDISGAPHPYVCISTNGGKSFTAPTRLDNTGSPGVSQRDVSIAPMPGGGIVAAWEDSRNGGWDIYASVVSANGKITTSNVKVDDDSTGANQVSPSVAADQLGNIYAAWTDERDLSSTAIRFSYLEAGNASFNASMECARPGGNDFQRTPSIITTEPGRVFVTWQDDKAGTGSIYSSSAYFPDLFGLSFVSGWNFVSIPTVGFGYMASTLGLMKSDLVVGWNSVTQTYDKAYIVGISPPASDFAINESTGYWIHVGSHERIKLKGYVPTAKQYKHIDVPPGGGYAIVGFESLNVTRHASDIPPMYTGQSITTVAKYNTATGEYTQYATGVPPTDFALAPGEAYWIYCTLNGTLTYNP